MKMVDLKIFVWFLAIGQTAIVQAHPGHDVQTEAIERAVALKGRRGLAHCADTFNARGLESRNIMRRDHAVQQIRRRKAVRSESKPLLLPRSNANIQVSNKGTEAPSLMDRDLGSLNTSHHSSLDVDFQTDPDVLFSSNGTCILTPDVTQGPYCESP